MEKRFVTYKKLLEIKGGLDQLDTTKKDRFSFAIDEFRDNIQDSLEYYFKEIDKINRKNCSVDRDNNFFVTEKGHPIFTKFNKTNIVPRDAEIEALLKKEVEISVCDCTDLTRINTLHISYLKLFNGFLFNISKEHMENLYTEKKPDKAPAPAAN